MPRNGGKGRAVRAGIEAATGDYLIIQDADLEYDPHDYVPMLRALLDGAGDIVYGSRYLGRGRYPNQSLAAYLGGRSLSVIGWAFTGRYLTDTVTALKLFHRTDLAALAAADLGVRTGPRDHGADAGARASGSSRSRSATTRGRGRKGRKSACATGSSRCGRSAASAAADAGVRPRGAEAAGPAACGACH